MNRITALAVTGAAVCYAYGVGATGGELLVRNLPDKGNVTVSGQVKDMGSNREFTLSDESGTIKVSIPADESVVMKNGDKVTVSGTVDSSFFGLIGKHIDASLVEVNKNPGEAMSDSLRKDTGISVDQAKTEQISHLSSQGMVKLSGTVADVIGPKSFTLEDGTGAITINMQSDENLALAKGAKVTLVGYVEEGMLGKDIRATHVIITSADQPHAQN